MPIYYYLSLANKSNDEGVAYINEVPINSMAKDLLKRRLNNREVKFSRLPNNTTAVTKKKKLYAQAILEHNLIIPSLEVELKYCLNAMRSLEPKFVSEHKDYILNILYEIYSTYFNSQPFSSIKSEFRYTLCWIDEALYIDRQ